MAALPPGCMVLDEKEAHTFYFKHPSNILIAGPSGSGKTQFVKKLVEWKDTLFDPAPQKVVWIYKEWQPAYTLLTESVDNILFLNGIPTQEEDIVADPSVPHLVIFDDMLGKDEEEIKLWFTRKGHHRKASVVYITQNLYDQTKANRTISLNAHYLVLFKNPRDKQQVDTLSRQLRTPWLNHAFDDATKEPFGYLLVDLKPYTPEHLRFRTDLFHRWTEEGGPVVYVKNV